ncbi:MAG TPA: hypothetical protein VNL91_05080 [Thermoanaerobaculia bacterium]|nr:hypothetical protein [Thermoanaerobaculia bacterium]
MSGCPLEPDVLRAAAAPPSGSLREHIETCHECRAAAAVAPSLARLASIDLRQRPLPDPSVLWLKARIVRGSTAASRAARPLNTVQVVAHAVVAGGWAGLLTWNWPALRAWMSSLAPGRFAGGPAEGASLSLTFFGLVLVLVTVTILLAMYTIAAEE